MKKKVHVVSHSHWDREWYLPLENHKMRLVDLIDGIIEASEDNRFINFQMDGQFLPIEDYLEVRPENRDIVYKLIKEGKIKVGPWYILQDAFLTSGESNVRNLEIGIKKAKSLGNPAMIGYFPDTFGNIGQAPQILKKAGIDNAYFGRGVKATGFANAVYEDFTSKNSELYWQAPDGSKVMGVLFANWYCNGVDMPSDRELLKKYLDKKIEDMEKYASTRHLLLMNGCDHSPVQKNIGEIIELANTLYDDYEFVHSDLETYAREVQAEVKEEDLDIIVGELRSQTTDGWGTLTNTSSSRYDLKYLNKTVEMRLEEVIQPLYTLFIDRDKYPHSKIDYIYRHLFTNHPHDSICGCSIDSVHQGNMRRFKDCMESLDYLEEQAKLYLKANVNNNYDEDFVFTVINTTAYYQRKQFEVVIDYDKRYFSGFEYHRIIEELKALEIPQFKVIDDNYTYETYIEDLGVNFGYDLPESSFRKGYYSRQILVKAIVEMDPFEKREFRLKEMPGILPEKVIIEDAFIDTNLYKVEVKEDASLTITDKRNNRVFEKVLALEDSGDIGNEYIYKQSNDNLVVNSSRLLSYSIEEETVNSYVIRIKESLSLPKSAEESLKDEQRYLIDIRHRKANRSKEYKELIVNKTVKVDKLSPTIAIEIDLENNVEDHRLRVKFGHSINNKDVYAESIFEVVKRPSTPPQSWENPDYTQNLNRFIQLRDENGGFTVSTVGVQEYENSDEGLYLTLFRATGEMGDWGYFPTKDSQLQKDMKFKLYLDYFIKDYKSSQQRALAARVPYVASQVDKNLDGIVESSQNRVDVGENIFSTLYRNEDGSSILRIYNPNDQVQKLGYVSGKPCNIIATEAYDDPDYNVEYLNPFEIRTLKLEEK